MVITISRTYGSGGRVMGKALAEKLGFKFYDAELMRMLSDETGINEALFGESDEKLNKKYIGTSQDWRTDADPLPPSDKKYVSEENLFKLQARMIRKLADEENCIIMGRCADAVLADREDVIRIFCYASRENCVKRTMEVCGLSEKDAEKRIDITDKFRQDYYHHFTGKTIDDAENYDLCLNTESMSVDELSDFAFLYVYAWKNKDKIKSLLPKEL